MSGDVLDTAHAGPLAFRGGVLRVLGYVVGTAMAVGSAAVLNRHLGLVDAGRYITVLSLATLAAGVSDAGLQAIAVREYAVRPPTEGDRVLRNLVTLRLALTGAGIAGAVGYALLAGFGPTLVLGTFIAGLGMLLQALQHGVVTVLMARLRFGWVTAIDLVRQLASSLIIIALVLVGAEMLPFFAATAIASLVALVLTVAVVRRSVLLRPEADRAILRDLLREALPFAAAAAAAALYLRVGVLVVELLSDARETGYYGVSFRIVEGMIAIPALAVSSAFPLFARAARDDAPRLRFAVQRTFEVSLLVGVGTAVVLAAGAPVAVDVIGGGREFAPAADVVRLHAVAVGLSFVSAVCGYALLSMRAHRALLAVTLVGLGVVLGGSIAGAEIDGARGAAIAAAAGELALAALGLVALRRRRVTLDLASLPRLAVAAALALLPALVLPPLPAAALAAAIFVGAAVALRTVPEELYAELRR